VKEGCYLFSLYKRRFEGSFMDNRFPYVATEVLCCDIYSIVATCLKEQQQLLVPFWETVLDCPVEELQLQTVTISHFTKVNAVFLTKRPEDVCLFQPLYGGDN
jgi:serine/threonine-protein phosphatase 6 regulatory subunit 3